MARLTIIFIILTLIMIVGTIYWIIEDSDKAIVFVILTTLCAFITGIAISENRYKDYDYFIQFDHNNIIIDSDYGFTTIIRADESIDSVLVNENI